MRKRAVLHMSWAALATGAILLEVLLPTYTNPDDWMWPFGLLPFPLAGGLILAQRPGNRVGRVLAIVGVASACIFAGGWLVMTWYQAWWSPYLEAVISPAVLVTFWGLVALLFIFPTGSPLAGWRWVLRLVTFTIFGTSLLLPFRPGTLLESALDGYQPRDNPLGFGPMWIEHLLDPVLVTLMLGALAGLVTLILRFRRSAGVERAQLKLFLIGALALLVLLLIISPLVAEDTPYEDALRFLVIAGFWGLPVTVVAAVLRYRLFEIDRLVSRTVTYVLVVGCLGVLWAGLVIGIRGLFQIEGDVPVAVSTLAVALAFLPLVRQVQRLVDRRFFRSRYDAGVVVARVAEELRGSLDLSEVTSRAEAVVSEVFSPETVGIWLAGEPESTP